MLLHKHQPCLVAWYWLLQLQYNAVIPEGNESAHLSTCAHAEQSCMHDAGRGGEGAGDEAAGDCQVPAGNEDGSEGSRRGEDQA